jgi:hypothetical protein
MSTPENSAMLEDIRAEDSQWADTQRLESWAGEMRLNVVRLLAIGVFYIRHLVEALASPADSPVRGPYHFRVTLLCMCWSAAAIVLHIHLIRRRNEPFVKYAATVFDAAMITVLCIFAGPARTPLLLLYFPVIAAAPLRLSLRLVYVATACAMAGYLVGLGYYAWYVVGFHQYYSTPALRIPRSNEAIVLLAMLTTGFLAGQSVRQMRRIAGKSVVTAQPAGRV